MSAAMQQHIHDRLLEVNQRNNVPFEDLVESNILVSVACKMNYRSAASHEQQEKCLGNGYWSQRISPCEQIGDEEDGIETNNNKNPMARGHLPERRTEWASETPLSSRIEQSEKFKNSTILKYVMTQKLIYK